MRHDLAQHWRASVDRLKDPGHKWVDTTLYYDRLYDGTVASDYYQSMSLVENRLEMPVDRLAPPPSTGRLLALVESLNKDVLNPAQTETVHSLQTGLLALSDLEKTIQNFNVPASLDLSWSATTRLRQGCCAVKSRHPKGRRVGWFSSSFVFLFG